MVTNYTTESLNPTAKYFLRDPLVQMCQKVELQCFSLCQTIHVRHDPLCFWKWNERAYRVDKRFWFFSTLESAVQSLYSQRAAWRYGNLLIHSPNCHLREGDGKVTLFYGDGNWQLERDTKVDFSLHCHRVSHTVTLQRESCIVRGWCGDVIEVTVLVRSERFPAPWR